MTDAPELLPCPFCGETSHLGYDAIQDAIMCFDCLCAGPENVSQTQAIAAWNRRATPAALAASPEVQAMIRAERERCEKVIIEAGSKPSNRWINRADVLAALRGSETT